LFQGDRAIEHIDDGNVDVIRMSALSPFLFSSARLSFQFTTQLR
jgi:hypothetical protein